MYYYYYYYFYMIFITPRSTKWYSKYNICQ